MKRKRRPRGSKVQKISVSVSADDLAVLKKVADARHGGNVSAAIHDLTAEFRREEALDELLVWLGADKIPQEEIDAVQRELMSPPRRRRSA
jgi:hypothetical protein